MAGKTPAAKAAKTNEQKAIAALEAKVARLEAIATASVNLAVATPLAGPAADAKRMLIAAAAENADG